MSAPGISLAIAQQIIASRAPDEIINRNGDPLFERWWVVRTPSDKVGPNVYLHRWLRSDHEDPHDHPWDSKTTVLSGWLDEIWWLSSAWLHSAPQGRILVENDSCLRLAEQIHAIADCEPGTISLFETTGKRRDWGFWLEGQFVPWQEYHGRRAAQVLA